MKVDLVTNIPKSKSESKSSKNGLKSGLESKSGFEYYKSGNTINVQFMCMDAVAGASTDPCSKLYQGPSPSSELETKAVQAEAVRLGRSLLTSIHLHVYGQKWLIPYGATHPDGTCVYAADHDDMVNTL